MSSKKATKSFLKSIYFWVTLLLVVIIVNALFLAGFNFSKRNPKVEQIGNTVVLRYSEKKNDYRIEGIENGKFNYNGTVHTFYDEKYLVREDGEPYNIVDKNGECVGNVKLKPNNGYASVYEIDLASLEGVGEILVKIPSNYEGAKVYTSGENKEYSISIQIEERATPIDVEFHDVTIRAPLVSPVLYSVSNTPVNVKIIGNVTLIGGSNPFTAEHVSSKDNFLSTLDVAANAYCVCMLSAIGTAASIVNGFDYYAKMFEGVTALQLNALGNAWGRVEELVNGKNGYPGLDGVPAVLIAGALNLVGNPNNATLSLTGGRGCNGGKGTAALTNKPDGGDGGNGGSALVCTTFATNLGDKVSFTSGEGGDGGEGGNSIMGRGKNGKKGGQNEAKIVLDREVLFS